MCQYYGKILTLLDNHIILLFKDGGEAFRDKLHFLTISVTCNNSVNLKKKRVKNDLTFTYH